MGFGVTLQESYKPEADALFAAMSTKPSALRQEAIAHMITRLDRAGVWSKLDMLQVYAGHNATAVLIDWKTPTRVASLVSSPSFQTDRGYTGNGTNSCINTNFNQSAGSNFAQFNAMFGVWTTSSATGSGSEFGTNGNRVLTRNASDKVVFNSGNSGSSNTSTNSVSAAGMTLINRTSQFGGSIFINGVQLETFSRTANDISSKVFYACAYGNSSNNPQGFSTKQIAAVFAGASLSTTQQSNFYSIMREYMISVGAA